MDLFFSLCLVSIRASASPRFSGSLRSSSSRLFLVTNSRHCLCFIDLGYQTNCALAFLPLYVSVRFEDWKRSTMFPSALRPSLPISSGRACLGVHRRLFNPFFTPSSDPPFSENRNEKLRFFTLPLNPHLNLKGWTDHSLIILSLFGLLPVLVMMDLKDRAIGGAFVTDRRGRGGVYVYPPPMWLSCQRHRLLLF